MQVIMAEAEKGEEGTVVAAMPVLRRVPRLKVNRRNEGIERLFLAQAPNQYSQHMADWVHIFSPRALALPPSFHRQNLSLQSAPISLLSILRGYQIGMCCRQMPGNTNLAYFEAG